MRRCEFIMSVGGQRGGLTACGARAAAGESRKVGLLLLHLRIDPECDPVARGFASPLS
jgi:hypothetical protein